MTANSVQTETETNDVVVEELPEGNHNFSQKYSLFPLRCKFHFSK